MTTRKSLFLLAIPISVVVAIIATTPASAIDAVTAVDMCGKIPKCSAAIHDKWVDIMVGGNHVQCPTGGGECQCVECGHPYKQTGKGGKSPAGTVGGVGGVLGVPAATSNASGGTYQPPATTSTSSGGTYQPPANTSKPGVGIPKPMVGYQPPSSTSKPVVGIPKPTVGYQPPAAGRPVQPRPVAAQLGKEPFRPGGQGMPTRPDDWSTTGQSKRR